ncbi:UPF0587 protein C1orf123 [Chionoecetes opilio]|uniref:UPF0587 protein C1orf123 n=1 Tax=Chionoecetes opilio TaxID=41210 RepID=A0A8J4YQD9_CHIOP|nr:UPF0587 protein C1orf123 [Chionoecetes opilio]
MAGHWNVLTNKKQMYTADDVPGYKVIIAFECRGLSVVDFQFRQGWQCEGVDSRTPFTDLDLDEEWCDYDEEANCPVGITELEYKHSLLTGRTSGGAGLVADDPPLRLVVLGYMLPVAGDNPGLTRQKVWARLWSTQDSLSSLHLLLSRHPRSSTSLVHTIQRVLHLTNEGWEIAFQCVPSHAGIPGNEVADSAARMALTDVNTTPFPLPLSTATLLISRFCRSTWNNTLGDALRITSMGQYRSDSSPQPWIRKKSRVLDVTLARLRLGHTTLTAHLHRLRLSPDPHCPWCMNFPETIEHFLLQCPHFHSHRVVLQSQLLALNVTTFDLPTLLAAAGVPPSRQHAVIRLTCAFLRKTGQLPRL